MPHPAPITLADYISALDKDTGKTSRPVSDDPLPDGCQRCHATITSGTAYFARFGLLRCRTCIGDDGFATAYDLDLFRQTGELSCAGCGQPVVPSKKSSDGTSASYHCLTCGTIVRYTLNRQALAIWGPGITRHRR
jgi:hypothetical protein